MTFTTRELTLEDHDEVRLLAETVWDGRDYTPRTFPDWIKSNNNYTLGTFSGNELVALANLELVPDTDIGWVEGLRVKDGYRDQGLGTRIVEEIVDIANKNDVKTLWYATGSLNDASKQVALNAGFHLALSVGYLKIESPYPDHPKPSPVVVPMEVGPSRLQELLRSSPDLVDAKYLPLAWSFEKPDLEGLQRLAKQTDFRVVIGEDGLAHALYYSKVVGTDDEKRATYSVFAHDRAIFVDVMSRILDDLESSGIGRAAFFLGPRAKEWSKMLGYVDSEQDDKAFLLYEMNP
ncbi:GNAT family N-acetyltransferase [Candidatus Thorarchaeota archaeon]|nr:MAG: GNAT family N-acetyltransferase [Candidatus Thorarchaeota archaeon]